MRKFMLASLIIGAFIIFSLVYNHTNTQAVLPTTPPASETTPGSAPTITGSTDTPTASSTPGNGPYKDGTYDGSLADAQWGNVQVRATIQKGRITNVTFLQYPNERERSVMINDYADPQLVNEAIQAQSAQVDIVTGATDTSEAFIQSLSDALSQAKA